MTGLAERLTPPESVPYPGVHLGLRWRTVIASDAPGVHALIRLVEASDEAHRRLSAAQIADIIEGRGGRHWVDALVGLDADNVICAVATVRVLRGTPDRANAVVNAYIHPHWRGRGLGRALLYWQDGRARQMLVETFGPDCELPASIHNFVDAHMTDRRRLYIAAGFFAKRTFQIMYRDLEGAEKPAAPRGGYRIVGWEDIPLTDLAALHARVFADNFRSPKRGEWWRDALVNLDARWSFAALSPEGDLVGYVLTGRPVERWLATGRTEAYISSIGVEAAHRGKGVGSALMSAAISAASASGLSMIGVDTDLKNSSNAHSIFEHFGFVDGPAEVFYTIDQ